MRSVHVVRSWTCRVMKVLSNPRAVIRCGVRRHNSRATRPPMECPASANRSGASSKPRSAISPSELQFAKEMMRTGQVADKRLATSSHGIASHIGPGLVQLASRRRGETLLLEIRDNGPGMPSNPPEGLGLRNTHERLRQTYGSSYSLEVRNQGERGVVVSCELPYRQFKYEEIPSDA